MADRPDIAFKPAVALAEDIRTGKIGSLEALEHFWKRIERFNPGLNAVVAEDMEGARVRARQADAALARGEFLGAVSRRADDHQGFL